MSPSESDLRAALRDGEGDGRPDVDGLLAHVRGRRAQRRTRVLSTAAAVVVVVAAAAGGAALWGGGSDGGSKQAGHAGAPSTAIASRTSQLGPGPTAVAPCPATFPGRTASGTVATTAGAMFSAPVASVSVCAYSGAGATTLVPTSAPLVLTGTDATALTASIEQASRSRLRIMCPDIASEQRTELAIIGVTSGGTQLPVVTTDVSIPNCNQPITNGSAVRYAWKPPAALAARINALGVRTGRSLPSGKNGTPVR